MSEKRNRPPPRSRWKKGQSGNPAGRPPDPLSVTAELKLQWLDPAPAALVKELFGPRVITATLGQCFVRKALLDCVRGSEESQLRARQQIWERLEGKPIEQLQGPQGVTADVNQYGDFLDPDFLTRLIADAIKDGRARPDTLAKVSPESGTS